MLGSNAIVKYCLATARDLIGRYMTRAKRHIPIDIAKVFCMTDRRYHHPIIPCGQKLGVLSGRRLSPV